MPDFSHFPGFCLVLEHEQETFAVTIFYAVFSNLSIDAF